MPGDPPRRSILLPTPGDTACPVCEFPNTPQSEVCGVCGADLAGDRRTADEPGRDVDPPPRQPPATAPE